MPCPLSQCQIDDLLYLARLGDLEEFDHLRRELCRRENISTSDLLVLAKDEQNGNGVLHMAAANGHHTLLRSLSKGLSHPSPQNPVMLAILNSQNHSGNTPLHWAALNGHLEAVKVLLEGGGDPTITNHRGHDAVYEAELNDKNEVVEWVLKEGGDSLDTAVGSRSVGGEEEKEDLGDNSVGQADFSESNMVSTEMAQEGFEASLDNKVEKMEINDKGEDEGIEG